MALERAKPPLGCRLELRHKSYFIPKLDYIHSPAHWCITQPPCVAPSGDSARVIALTTWRPLVIAKESYRKLRKSSTFAICQTAARRFKLHFPPLSFGKSVMKIRSAVPENGCLIFLTDGKKTKKTTKQKNICKTYMHLPPTGRRLRKLLFSRAISVRIAKFGEDISNHCRAITT